MTITPSVKCILCWKFVSVPEFEVHLRSVHVVSRSVSQDLVVVVSRQSDDQLGQLRQLLASCIAELGGGGGEATCPLCGERQEGDQLGGHLVHHHAHCPQDTAFSQQLGLLPPERLRQLLAVLDGEGSKKRKRDTEYIEDEDKIKEEPKESHQCQFCDFQTISSRNLALHERRHSQVKERLQCEDCESSFTQKGSLANHILRKHSGLETEHSCKECDKKFDSKSQLKRHSKIHLKVRHFQCEYCSFTTDTDWNLHLHLQTHGDMSDECQICGKKMSSESSLKNHLKRFHSESEKRYECKTCGKLFLTSKELKTHSIIHEENRPKPFVCDICDFKTDTNRNLELHKNIHSDTRVTCSVCEQEFSSAGSLSQHVKRIHTLKQKHNCDQCKMSFFSSREKLSHLQTHGEITLKELECDVCGYKTRRNGDLKRHKVTHMENKPDNFKCNICDYKTWQKKG